MAEPLLSIIVVSYNRSALLDRALANFLSILPLDYPNHEVIVVDGGSTDGSVEVIQKHAAGITKWISEPDKGVGDAVNKGIALAKGEVMRFIGDDDEMLPGGNRRMMELLIARPELDVVIGHNRIFLEDVAGNREVYPQMKLEGLITLKSLLMFPKRGLVVPECAFFRRRVIDRVKGYDLQYRYWGYLDLFIRVAEAAFRIEGVPEVILDTLQTPMSDSVTQSASARWAQEHEAIIRAHGGERWVWWHRFGGELTILSPLKWLLRRACEALGTTPRQLLRFGRCA